MKRQTRYPRIALALIALALPAALQAATAAGWRTDGTGRYPEAKPPVTWAGSSNVVWRTPLPRFSNASPLILGDRLFVCAEPDALVCLALADGKVLWQKANPMLDALPPEAAARAREDRAKAEEIEAKLKPLKQQAKQLDNQIKKEPENAEAKTRQQALKKEIGALEDALKAVNQYADPSAHDVNGFSSATPATDGRNVYVLFGTGVAACYDPDGNRVWARFIEKPTQGWGHSASPLVVGNAVLCHIVKMTALNAATGEVLWQANARPAWGSPVLARAGEAEVIVTPGGDILRPSDGKLLAGKVSRLEYCAPVVDRDKVYFVENGAKSIRLPANGGESLSPETIWTTTPRKDRYYASPLYHEGLLYAVTQKGEFSVIDAATGKVVAEKKLDLGGTFYPSVTLAGPYVFVSSDSGKTVVLEPGQDYKEVARNTLEPFRCSPVFLGERMYVRTLKAMVCIGK